MMNICLFLKSLYILSIKDVELIFNMDTNKQGKPITYEKGYLSIITDITDAYSGKIMGYHVSQYLKAQGCIIALNKSISGLSSTEKREKKTYTSLRQRYTILL
jgi:hypothetical protein